VKAKALSVSTASMRYGNAAMTCSRNVAAARLVPSVAI
jgi:hypothetical protein